MVEKVVKWTLLFTKSAKKDAKKIVSSGLTKNVDKILNILEINPLQNPPPFEKLTGDLNGAYSRRVNIQHRIVYDIDNSDHTVIIHRMFTHYE
jgi:Txe/YoeB family toxin of toxin-antitoxin system